VNHPEGRGAAGRAVSVIMPVKNCARFLGAAIGSVLDQASPPREIVVVDGGSTDDSVSIARSYPRVRVVARAKLFLEPGSAIPPGFRAELLEGDHIAHIMETLLARRTAFDLVGGFDTRLSTAEDVDWFSRARDLGVRGGIVDRVLVYKRVHDGNLSLTDAASSRNLLEVVKRSLDRRRGQRR
jgi:GT2 family glycosyltransferase